MQSDHNNKAAIEHQIVISVCAYHNWLWYMYFKVGRASPGIHNSNGILESARAPPTVWQQHQYLQRTGYKRRYAFSHECFKASFTALNASNHPKTLIFAILTFKKNSATAHAHPTNSSPALQSSTYSHKN